MNPVLRRWKEKRRPSVPEGVRIYAIGDIHGRVDLLLKLFGRIEADLAVRPVPQPLQVFLGDYIDRGPDSSQVLDLLVARERSIRSIFLKGNHEEYLIEFLRHPPVLADWQRFGGLQTLLSYGLKPSLNANVAMQARLAAALREKMPESHRQFLGKLESSFTCGDFFFVHAGVRPGVPLSKQREEDLLWIRQEFLLHDEPFTKIIVHGHTPVVRPEIHPHRINIDTGAYASGQLTCLALEGDQMDFI